MSWDGERDLAVIAEDVEAYACLQPGDERTISPDAVLFRSGSPLPQGNGVSRLRLREDEVAARVAEVRAWFAERDRPGYLWNVGPHATPPDLERRLLDLGMVPDPSQTHGTIMVLGSEPPAVRGPWEIRREASLEDVVARWELLIEVFGWPEADAAAVRADYEASWERTRTSETDWSYVASIDGRIAAVAHAIDLDAPAVFLGGAATSPWARGRGLYRALVRRRWDDAVAIGKDALIIQASDAARAVLEPLGFRPYGRVSYLLDRSDGRP